MLLPLHLNAGGLLVPTGEIVYDISEIALAGGGFMVRKNFRVTTKMPPLPEIFESDMSMFDPTSEDLNMMNLVDEENIRLSGSKLEYYKLV